MATLGRRLAVICAVICALLLFSVTATAGGLSDVYIIADFDEPTNIFSAGTNADGVRTAVLSTESDGAITERTCLEVMSNYRYINSLRCTTAKFDSPLDLSEYRTVSYDIFVPLYEYDPSAVYYTRIRLFSEDGNSTESLVSVKGGVWNTVEADISEWSGRSAVVSAEIALTIDTSVVRTTTNGFYIDSVYASGVVDRQMTSRFLFDSFEVSGGEYTVAPDKSSITFRSDEPTMMQIFCETVMPKASYPVNCLRIRLANGTDSTSLIINYRTMDSKAVSEDKSVTVSIEPRSDARYYYAYVGDASMLQNIEMIFGDGYGIVELISVSPVHRYVADDYAVCGEITACKLYSSQSISFSGNVNRDAALAYQDSRIAIYAWNCTELPSVEELAALTPLASGDMTTRFELIHHIQKNNPTVRNSCFIAVVLHADGTYTLISEPFYVDNPELGAGMTESLEPDAKGFCADDLSLVMDTDSGVTVQELDAGKMFAAKNEGQVYTYGGCSYYLNGSYIDSVNKKIKLLSTAGTSVLIRLVGWSDELGASLTESYSSENYVSYVVSVDAVDGTDYLGAISGYIADMWCADGSVCGVIFGNMENRRVSGDISLTEQAENTVRQLKTVHNHIISSNSGAKVYISVDDAVNAEPMNDFSRYMLDDYLHALISSSNRLGGFDFDIAIEISEEDNEAVEYVEISDCAPILALLEGAGVSDRSLIFCDDTYTDFEKRLSTLMQNYVLGYYNAYFNDRVDAYIAFSGPRGAALAETVRYIDTTDVSIIANAAILTTGVDSIDELIDGYNGDKLKKRVLSSSEMTTQAPDDIKGVYRYFEFDSMADITGIFTASYGGELNLVNDEGSAMAVPLRSDTYGDGGRASWFGIMHNFEYPESIRLTPVIKVTLKLDGVSPDSLTETGVKLVLTSQNERFEATAVMPVGEWVTLYVNTKPFGGRRNTESIRLLVGDAKIDDATLIVKEIDGLSTEYDSEELAGRIAEEREKNRSQNGENDYRTYYWIGGAFLIIVATVLILVLLSRRRNAVYEED